MLERLLVLPIVFYLACALVGMYCVVQPHRARAVFASLADRWVVLLGFMVTTAGLALTREYVISIWYVIVALPPKY